jgi:hypothetical protein
VVRARAASSGRPSGIKISEVARCNCMGISYYWVINQTTSGDPRI